MNASLCQVACDCTDERKRHADTVSVDGITDSSAFKDDRFTVKEEEDTHAHLLCPRVVELDRPPRKPWICPDGRGNVATWPRIPSSIHNRLINMVGLLIHVIQVVS